MVGPIPDEERRAATQRLRIGFVVFVGLSAGLVTLAGEPTIPEVVLAVCLGLVVGLGVVAVAFPGGLGS